MPIRITLMASFRILGWFGRGQAGSDAAFMYSQRYKILSFAVDVLSVILLFIFHCLEMTNTSNDLLENRKTLLTPVNIMWKEPTSTIFGMEDISVTKRSKAKKGLRRDAF